MHTLSGPEKIQTSAGELEASVHDYSTVLQIEADHVEATFHRGSVYEKLGKLDEAIVDFSKVLSLEPDHVKASYARGTCRNLKGDFAPAIGAHAAPMCMRTAPASSQSCCQATFGRFMLACMPQRHIDKLLGDQHAVLEAVSYVQDASLPITACCQAGCLQSACRLKSYKQGMLVQRIMPKLYRRISRLSSHGARVIYS